VRRDATTSPCAPSEGGEKTEEPPCPLDKSFVEFKTGSVLRSGKKEHTSPCPLKRGK